MLEIVKSSDGACDFQSPVSSLHTAMRCPHSPVPWHDNSSFRPRWYPHHFPVSLRTVTLSIPSSPSLASGWERNNRRNDLWISIWFLWLCLHRPVHCVVSAALLRPARPGAPRAAPARQVPRSWLRQAVRHPRQRGGGRAARHDQVPGRNRHPQSWHL